MKNDKAFTLIELLAVIVILITLTTIITAKVFKHIKTAEEIAQKEQIKTIIDTAKLYTNQNTILLPEKNNISSITLNQLKEAGLIKIDQILNPKTKEELTGCIVVKSENNNYKYEYKEECELVTVTFDSQGGQLDQTTKTVLYHGSYGTLPIPTKEGYTFKGWNGKNMFDLKENADWQFSGEISTNLLENSVTIKGNEWAFAEYYLPILKSNTNYSISGNIELINLNNTYVRIAKEREKSNNNIFILNSTVNNGYFNLPITINDSDETTSALILYGNIGKVYETSIIVSNIQLEEGNTATEYEPYYITNDTTVVQENNHTLKAIWETNE